MERVQHEESVTLNKCNTKKVQHEKSATGKENNTKKLCIGNSET